MKQIPVVKSIVSIYKIGAAFRERSFVKKILRFVIEFRNGNVDPKKLNDFRYEFEVDQKYRDHVMDFLLTMLDRLLAEKKAEYLAKLFCAYVSKEYDWDTFVDLSTCIDSMLLIDFKVLDLYYNRTESLKAGEIPIESDSKYLLLAAVTRLKSFGFLSSNGAGFTWDPIDDEFEHEVSITDVGRKFYNAIV